MEDAPKKSPSALIRIGPTNYVEEFLREGHLYMNTLGYFLKLEGDTVRADVDEAIYKTLESDRVAVRSHPSLDQWLVLDTASGVLAEPVRVKLWHPHLEGLNVACFYGIKKAGRICVDPKCADFGPSAVVVLHFAEFMRRVQAAAERVGRKMFYGSVEYVPRSYNGEMGPFRKFDDYAYQQEYRIVFTPFSDGPLSIRIGSIEDIATLCPFEQLNYVELEIEQIGEGQKPGTGEPAREGAQ